MEAGPRSIKAIFDRDLRLLVPLFQRPYVWTRENQWGPLWNDIRGLAERLLDGKEVRPHFLGAIVLDHVRKPTGSIETRTIIDGQQRLTTIQLFLEALCDICRVRGDDRHTKALEKLTRNSDPMSDDPEEVFKVWPTNADREHFRRVMEVASPVDLLHSYGKKRTSVTIGQAIGDAYLYFFGAVESWLGADTDLAAKRISSLYNAIREHLQVVAIDLGLDDDAQMIFETLNARGTPLLPSDLVKNFLFHLAKIDDRPEDLYERYWRGFDDDGVYWRARVGRGLPERARIDLFLQHYLTLKRGDAVEVAHLYGAYRDVVRDSARDARHHLEALHRYAGVFRGFSNFPAESREGRFFRRLDLMDVGTAYPFLLGLFQEHRTDEQCLSETLEALESWLVRRMICRLNTRGYNQLFIELLKSLPGPADELPQRVRSFLLSSDAESQRWPNDREFKRAWLEEPLYAHLVQARVRFVLEALELHVRTGFTEQVSIQERLTIEHVMPRVWHEYWPLPAVQDVEVATDLRNRLMHTIGNLTLLTKRLNPSISNGPWKSKRAALREHSVLKLNHAVAEVESWSEESIQSRGAGLFEIARKIWPFPGKGD